MPSDDSDAELIRGSDLRHALPAEATWRSTGTHADAISFKQAIRETVSTLEQLHDAGLLNAARDDIERFRAYRTPTDDSAGMIWIDPGLVDPIDQSSLTVPAPSDPKELVLPGRHGAAVFGKAVSAATPNLVADTRNTGDQQELDEVAASPYMTAAGLTWSTIEDGSMMVTRWFRVTGSLSMKLYPAPEDIIFHPSGSMTHSEADLDWWSTYGVDVRWLKLLTAIAGWCASPSIAEDTDHYPRAERKRLDRAQVDNRTVRVVRMRRKEADSDHPGEDQGDDSSYTHQWVVSGHWRNQPCGPDRSQRRPVWISPYIKGPEDKPLIVKPTIWKVDRR
ncbi:MAG: hypothetical protein ACRBK7_14455 [Acidimicrobiales bacterium]